jgi:hypothetical protein
VADTSRPKISGDAIIGGVTSKDGGPQMAQWLIADISLLDVHLQLWMLLVVTFMLLWIVDVWVTR